MYFITLNSAEPVDDVEHSEGPGCDGEEDELQHVVPVTSCLRLRRAKRLLLPLALDLVATDGDAGPGDGTAQSEENDHVADQRAEGEGDAGETPELQVCHSCRGDGGARDN